MIDIRGASLVFAGGAIGSLCRYALDVAIGERVGLPMGILVVNIAGAFLLGLLLATFSPQRGDRWRSTRLFIGTGILGGFTTYSALSLGVVELLLDGHAGLGALYGASTLVLGGLASWCGAAAARGGHAMEGAA